jgi:predicted CoA-binding protein
MDSNLPSADYHIVLGASSNSSRASYMATQLLQDANKNVAALGIKGGKIGSIPIIHPNHFMINSDQKIDTITLYINPLHQEAYYDWIISLCPRRVIFNPGTENSHFESMLEVHGIISDRACTLVLLNIGAY